MTNIEPRFFETEYKILAHLEWEAIRMIVFNGSHMNIADAYPKFEQRQFYWIDPFNDKASEKHHAIKRKIHKREYLSLDDFYLALKPLLKSQKKVRLLKMQKSAQHKLPISWRNLVKTSFIILCYLKKPEK